MHNLQHTLGHLDCPACETSRIAIMHTSDLASLTFNDAYPVWLESRKRYISPRTFQEYEKYMKALAPFFGKLILKDIHVGHLHEFQAVRGEKVKKLVGEKERMCGASGIRINHELGGLQQIMRRAGLWAAIEPFYETLPMPRPKLDSVLTPEEEHRFFQAARKRPRWKVAYWASSLTANTTAGPGEIKHLRLGDVDLEKKLLYIREGTKNEYRVRRIPLNERAFRMACRLKDRAINLGATAETDYLLPHRATKRNGGWDFTRPMYSWYTAWRAICKEAQLTLTPYRLRHLSITKLVENPDVSEETVKSIAGHVSQRMLEHYSHVRLKAKEDAVKALEQPSGRMGFRAVPEWAFHRPVEKKA